MNTDSSQGNNALPRPALARQGKTLEFPRMSMADEAQESADDAASCNDGVCMVNWKPPRPAA